MIPGGLELKRYLANPIVTARHLMLPGVGELPDEIRPVVVARTLALAAGEMELSAELQFADTQDGRDNAWLYGANPERQAYMRAFSIEAPILESLAANWEAARRLSGQYWDETLAERIRKRATQVMVAVRAELKSVALVASGADRGALTRA